ncbi:hypothetical protein GCK72_018246 [Caenorhabditis remanei]|uniref:Uncharacterized protein n=1 Tax=Caenorhabditis remanei TaxID=31234 RepID=A0A6A5GB07_CAERE|nr:hypothetical protein GCK72_018246 [Caenorhabditis remanei]KAF1751692.1 hypothetical protein GCK72_018246 [Caenorhabditis remanei]
MPKSNPVTPNKQSPEDWNDLLNEFVQKTGRGLQKTFIKKMWAVHEDLLANAKSSPLRMMFFSPALTICPEGVKLVAEVFVKIGISNGLTLLEKNITKFDITDAECQRYGEVFKTAWLDAYQDASFDLTEEIETDVIRIICQYALYGQKPFAAKFRKVLSAFVSGKKKDVNFAEMITRILNGCLYRAMDATNYIVSSSAVELFFMFFPLISQEELEERENLMANQLRYMSDLLRSDIVSVRTQAASSVLKALAEYWDIIPKDMAKELLTFIIDVLSRDSVVGVRVAVYDGLNEMAFIPSCMNVFEHGLKCAVQKGVLDASERVRLAAFQAMARMKQHKFISPFDIIERDDSIAVFELETVEECRRQLVPVMHIIMPISENIDEEQYRLRVNHMLKKSRIALLTYFRLLGPMKIIDPKQAGKLIIMFNMWAYRYLRRKGDPLPETSEGLKKARSYLECSLIIYMSCKKMLLFDCNENIKSKCDQQFGKIVKLIFEQYGNTPILGTATAISSVIPKESLKSVATDVLARLADDEVPEEALEPFLESAIHFNPDAVFDSLSNGLDVFYDLYGDQSKQTKKKKRNIGIPDELLTSTLKRLKYTIQSHSTSSLLATNDIFKPKILGLMKKVDLVREAIEVRLSKKENEDCALRDETLILALEFRFILPLYAVSENQEGEKERMKLIESIKALMDWFETNIAKKMCDFGDHNQDFFIKLSTSFLNCINVALSAYDFKMRPLEYEDEEDEENHSPTRKDKEDEETVAVKIARIVRSFVNSGTPIDVYVPTLRVAATLCDDSYSEAHNSIAQILRFTNKWVHSKCELETFSPEQEKETVEAIRHLYKRVIETGAWDEKCSNSMINNSIIFSFHSSSEAEKEFEDPRHEDFKPSQFISMVIIKFFLKDKSISDEFFNTLSCHYINENSVYFNCEDEDDATFFKLSRLAALSHFLRVLERYSKYHTSLIKNEIEHITTRVLDIFASASDLNTVPHHVMNSLSILLDVGLPDGF